MDTGGDEAWGRRGQGDEPPRTSLEKRTADGASGGSAASAAGEPGDTVASNDVPGWAAPSVHDQRTVTSMPPPWANPSATATPAYASNPFAAPAVPYPQGEPVPPPPIAPDGPGRMQYGYPGYAGYPGGSGYPGYPGHAGYGWPGLEPMPSNGLGTAGLVLGIISAAVFCLWPVAIVVGVLALIFGTIGRSRARRGEATNAGQALAGIICGAAGVVLGFVMLAFVIATR